ncbi:MAG: hypothetical protein G3M70_15640 [Candidatus Nitronauta litoralis]|uniref:Uncharacterized protein n=1 Tax=Candidatus Nitronauta litoralis TaxID=2705533 RepID=A0A7T0G1S0_9BACT|nr:MAG: hypothetical protein G3M70_15640 [Candidatus Nitronauta litoralis]
MSAFNTVFGETDCHQCGEKGQFEVQFKYGSTWQFEYKLGDKIKWGGNDKGKPEYKKVLVEGFGGPCPHCGANGIEFDVLIENNQIISIKAIGFERPTETDDGYVLLE